MAQSCWSRTKSCLSCMTTLLIMGILAIVLWHFLGRPDVEDAKEFWDGLDFGDFTDVLDNFTDFDWGEMLQEDPYVGDNTTNAWKTRGQGLTLELQNALDDNWQNEFDIAVADWQQSEVLDLSTQRVAVDHSCARVDGVMLVCNGNFGETGWVGINEVEIEYTSNNGPGFIISSVAKMNEYYLHNAPFEKRRYTMCHEIGHGFGLPHTDENPNNRDLGNCLDYTNTPTNNQEPGEVNFARLRSIYIAGEGQGQGQGQQGQGQGQGQGKGQEEMDATALQRSKSNAHVVTEDRHDIGPDGRYLRRVVIRHYHPAHVYDEADFF